MSEIEGYYSGHFTGSDGEGFGMFILRQGLLTGADPLGVRFDGGFQVNANGGGHLGTVEVTVPPNATLIQGVTAGPSGMVFSVPFTLPADFQEQPFIRIDTPLGPVNVRLRKLRDLERRS